MPHRRPASCFSISAAGRLLGSKLYRSCCFNAAVFCVSGATIASFGKRVPYAAIAGLCAAGLAAFCWFMFVAPDLTARLYAINFAFGGVSLVVAAELRAVPNKGPMEKILFALALMASLNFLVRPVLIITLQGAYESYDGFYNRSTGRRRCCRTRWCRC